MKALLLGLVLAFPFSPFPFTPVQEVATLSLLAPAATGISHGYALWTTGQISNPYGCLFGSAHPKNGVVIYGAGMTDSPESCTAQANAIGMLFFVREAIPQEKVCEAARKVREDFPRLVLMGTVHGLKIGKLQNGLDYPSPRVTWCATPILTEQFFRPVNDPDGVEPARQT